MFRAVFCFEFSFKFNDAFTERALVSRVEISSVVFILSVGAFLTGIEPV